MSLLSHLSQIACLRQNMATQLDTIADTLRSLQVNFDLTQPLADLSAASQSLRQGVFRLMVLGDMKRGKSTFLNALLGESLLPSDVNPCTALLTVLRYGTTPQVTVYFTDERPSEQLDMDTFTQRYTIDPGELRQAENKAAFAHVSHAVIHYPLPLLQNGVEIVDSPGLNDTEARNQLSLGYIQNCHAILFMLRATQPCTLAERRYLNNYLQNKGLSLFFLLNAWDQIKESLLDPDDPDELAQAEKRLHTVFYNSLKDYCDHYEQRVFPISALDVLRQRLKSPNVPIQDPGFARLLTTLDQFLTQERARAEFQPVVALSHRTLRDLTEKVQLRQTLWQQNVAELKQTILQLAPVFEQLVMIRDDFQTEIRQSCDRNATTTTTAFKDFILNLETTFEQDFAPYQPDLSLLDLVSPAGRQQFNQSLETAFQRYLNDQLLRWSRSLEPVLRNAFQTLSQRAAHYGTSYNQITQKILTTLSGQSVELPLDNAQPSWAAWAINALKQPAETPEVQTVLASLNLQSILINVVAAIGASLLASSLISTMAGPITLGIASLGIGALQMDQIRRALVQAARQELSAHLPRIAAEQQQPIYTAMVQYFRDYEQAVISRLDADITARKADLETLLAQKQEQEHQGQCELEQLQIGLTQLQQADQAIQQLYSQV
ncbi:dynamin family protein [Leptolyngbya sp. Heron Island J]|uniref:dynamin family protein n=1 Tax=Leptolyngbya sp. Heron Island J TaxID=1385935 RepID=UPI0003B98196|nr:dynamin family protein [Leptolyngbya sp. Heron Island J]ESA38564.1 dynamin family protein [Leptolyngbya sp. Heron Island J]